MNSYAVLENIRVKNIFDFVDQPVTAYVNDFDDKTIKNLSDCCSRARQSGQTILPVVINSPGGMVANLYAMVDILSSSGLIVATVGVGRAASCGAVLVSFGTKGYRFAAPNSYFLMHEVSAGEWGKNNELQSTASFVDGVNKRLMEQVSINCGHDKDYFKHIIHERGHADMYLTAQEAMNHGLVDRIGMPDLVVRVTAKYELIGA